MRETGVKPDTLRAWERRYGLPEPLRTPGGHRLYSQRDIDTIKWLLARLHEGLNISNAVELWQTLKVEGRDPLQSGEYAVPGAAGPATAVSAGTPLADLRRAWIDAGLHFDERGAESIVSQAFGLCSPETVCVELLQKGLAEIGEAWYRGETTAQQEHFSSALAMRRLEALVATTPAPSRAGRMLVGCPPEEGHAFAALLLTFLLRRRGWDVVYLGADVPVTHLDATIASTTPRLAIFVAQQLHTAATLLEVAQLLRTEDVPLAFGGRVFNARPALRSRMPGHFLGERLELAPEVVEQLLTAPRPLPRAESASEAYQAALAHFRDRQGLLEARVSEAMEATAITQAHVATAMGHLARNVVAALMLGDVGFLDDDIAWVTGLLGHRGVPADLLQQLLGAYHQAVCTHLDDRGRPIREWLELHAPAEV